MATVTRFPASVSVYEALRTHPSARPEFQSLGLVRDYLDYRMADAARAVGLPIERLAEILATGEKDAI